MKRQPTSYGDMLKTVAAVNCPELTDEERHFLLAIALNASQTGEHAFPGNVALGERVNRAGKTITRRWMRLENLGLISVQPSPAKGVANIFKIELTHPAYPETYEGRDEAPRVMYSDARQKLPSAISTPATRHVEPPRASFEQNPGVMYSDALSFPPSTATSTAAILPAKATAAAAAADSYKGKSPQLTNLLRWMQQTFTAKSYSAETLKHSKEHDAALSVILADYGDAVVRVVWQEFLAAEQWSNSWKFHLKMFNDEFVSYLTRAERNPSRAAGREELWKIRWDLSFALMGGAAWYCGFKDTMTLEEAALYERHSDYLKRTKGNTSAQLSGINLAFAGPVFRLSQRAKDWEKENAELVERLTTEIDEEEPQPEPVAADGSNEE